MDLRTKDYWVTEFNYMDEVVKDLNIPERVEIYDVTLREGNQTPGCVMRKEEQLAIAKDLDKLGVEFIEFFPAVSKDDEAVATELATSGVLKHAKVSCLVRPRTTDMDYAIKCQTKHIFLEGPSNMQAGRLFGYTSENEIIQSFVDTVKIAKANGMTVTAAPWDNGKATTLPLLERWVKELAAAGVEDICYADSFNFTMPWTVTHMVRKYCEWAGPDVIVSTHFHNDYGVATACTLAAVAGGAKRVQVAMNNLGERAGNTALDEVALNLALNMGVKTNIDLKQLYPLSKKIESITKIPVGVKKPVTGDEVFLQGSGIIVDLLQRLKEEGEGMECSVLPFNPTLVGAPSYKIGYGKGCGHHMVARLIAEMGLKATREQENAVAAAIKEESMLIKSLLTDFRVEEIIRNTCK